MRKILFAIVCLSFAITCPAATITVKPDGTGDQPTIQAAIVDANNGDEVVLEPGTYTGPGNRDLDFLGKAITVRSTDPNDPDTVAATIIDCNGSESESHRAFHFHSTEGPNSVLTGLTITRGYAIYGAGIRCNTGVSPTISNCIITGNSAVSAGSTDARGSGIYCYKSNPTISNCNIVSNLGDGTGIHSYFANPKINYCIIADNPGGINCVGSCTVSHCIITGNRKSRSGGGFWTSGGTSNLEYCIITNNSSSSYGGGILFWNSSGTISNCIIAGNSSNAGGGISCLYISPTITNCTITNNSCRYNGGGLYCKSGSKPNVSNCIIWDNIAGTGQDISVRFSSELTVSYSNIKGGQTAVHVSGATLNWGSGNIEDDPLLVDSISGDYHLAAQSPCINSGDPNYIPTAAETDIDGDSRVINGLIDIGADEFSEGVPVIRTSPLEMYFSCYKGQGDPEPQILTIRNIGTDTINWEVIEDCAWLAVDPCNGESSGEVDEVTVRIDTSGLSSGSHSYQIKMAADEAINNPQITTVTLDILEPVIEAVPSQIEFVAPEGQRYPGNQILNIRNSGTGVLKWSVLENCNWLEVNPSYGESTGESDEVTLTADISGLVPGVYDCLLSIIDANAANSPYTVMVALNVSEPYIKYTPVTFGFFSNSEYPIPSDQILSISNAGGGSLDWEIVEDCNWLQVTPLSGDTTDETDEVVLNVDTNELESGSYSCLVTISATGATNDPQSIAVSLYIHSDGIETLYVPSQFSTIQAAIDAGLDGDTVIVAEGTYTGIGNRDIDFKGKNITIQSTEPNCPTVVASTIIDCNGTVADPHLAFYFHSGENANSILNGLTIKNGYAHDGGAIHCYSSSPTITNCNFIDCAAERWGGGINCYKASPLISYCTFTGNSAFEGGAITTRSNWGYTCSPLIRNCHIFGNTASGSGGGINSDCISNPIISECLITGNFAGTYGGGGISIFQSNPTITNCIITDNSTDSSGGGILQWYEFENGSTITNCIIANNNAMHFGGGVYGSANCDMTITNSAVFGNSGMPGGGVFCEWMQSLTMKNCTIADNSEINVFLDLITGELTNNIIWSNMPHESLTAFGNIIVSYCDITGCGGSGPGWMPHLGIDGGGNIDTYPLFVNSATGNYHLLPGSPCLDVGDPYFVPEPDEKDIDDQTRVNGLHVDMGADEIYPNVSPVACIIGIGCDRLVEVGTSCEAKVTLDGSCSSDVDSSLGTNDDIEYFGWYKVDPCDSNLAEFLASGEIIDCNLPLGEHNIILQVTDKAGAFDTNEVTIIVQDITPPDFDLSVTPTTLWPPNNKMVEITPAWTVSDLCDASPEVSLVSVTMHEDGETTTNGHADNSVHIDENGSIYLRAQRSGTGGNRTYTITYEAVDDSENVTVQSATVVVPHAQGGSF